MKEITQRTPHNIKSTTCYMFAINKTKKHDIHAKSIMHVHLNLV